jgi:hypothetical protein
MLEASEIVKGSYEVHDTKNLKNELVEFKAKQVMKTIVESLNDEKFKIGGNLFTMGEIIEIIQKSEQQVHFRPHIFLLFLMSHLSFYILPFPLNNFATILICGLNLNTVFN